ncbi:hypothetical protein [Psychromonas sp. SP041]|uniref:hypothetical protein n=1 Tax=Psychromonas sp. SP041 TaxID=1365007 RepID=UPI00046EC804|nr:hypothetical protein [Psychromonas sp. SP041]
MIQLSEITVWQKFQADYWSINTLRLDNNFRVINQKNCTDKLSIQFYRLEGGNKGQKTNEKITRQKYLQGLLKVLVLITHQLIQPRP